MFKYYPSEDVRIDFTQPKMALEYLANGFTIYDDDDNEMTKEQLEFLAKYDTSNINTTAVYVKTPKTISMTS